MAVAINHDANGNVGDAELRVRLAFRIPIDPMDIVSMADYDMALLLCRNWFDFDEGRTAKPGLIEKWSYDSTMGGYWFDISKNAKWSDGSPIVSEHLIFNLKRILSSKTSYAKSISALMTSEYKIENETRFFVRSVSRMPVDSFFQRMGSIFLSIIHPDSIGSDGKIKNNNLSAGPFVIHKLTTDEVVLIQNRYWSGHSLKNAAKKIIIRRPLESPDLNSFLENKSWENLTQVASVMPANLSQKLYDRKLPIWTRDYDRVSLMKPVEGSAKLEIGKQIIKRLWAAKGSDTLNVNAKSTPPYKVANSLQPLGYPLFNDIKNISSDHVETSQTIRIAAINTLASRTQMELLKPLFAKIKVVPSWEFLPREAFIPLLSGKNNYDFLFFDFGVADPEPMTWLSLIVNMKFVYMDKQDKSSFTKISGLNNKDKEIEGLKDLLSTIAKKGGYVSLFHFSTLSIGQLGMSFEKIRDLDETVDYSKIIFK